MTVIKREAIAKVLGLAFITGSFLGYAQTTPSPQQKAETPAGRVWFSLTDPQNRYITDLKKEEVTIWQNDKLQELLTLKLAPEERLALVLLVDVSSSQQYVFPQLKSAGAQFINSVIRPGQDTAAIIKFEGEPTVVQPLTSDQELLRIGLSQLAYVPYRPGSAKPPKDSRQGGTSLYDSVVAVSTNLLGKEVGRKIIVLLTDGIDTTSRLKMQDAINEALRAEVMIYALGIGDPAISGTFGGSAIDEGGLKKITESTGGRTFAPKNPKELANALELLREELRQQYLVEYMPKDTVPNNKPQRLEVRLSSRGKLKVRAAKYMFSPFASGASK